MKDYYNKKTPNEKEKFLVSKAKKEREHYHNRSINDKEQFLVSKAKKVKDSYNNNSAHKKEKKQKVKKSYHDRKH